MTVEYRVLVRMPKAVTEPVLDLVARADAALARAKKLPAGDRTEAVRFESLHAAIDQLAVAAMVNGEPYEILPDPSGSDASGPSVLCRDLAGQETIVGSAGQWIAEGSVVVELCLPHFRGKTRAEGKPGTGPPKPAARWASTAKHPKDAVRERFESLLAKATGDLATAEYADDGVVLASGIANSVLTEGLRVHIQRKPGHERVEVPVVYRDGSKGAPFPLRALAMTERIPEGWRTFRFALMSIRHVEMDAKVDGAWLRNTTVSRKRPAGFTDQVVYDISRRQLQRLASGGPALIYMYQTGLETAIIGFYRALAHQLLDKPGSIAVVPCFYQSQGPFLKGTLWATT